MSGISDSGDNSDLQRIREVNQADQRRRIDEQKRLHQARVERSFKDVMAERDRERSAQQAQRQSNAQQASNAPKDAAGRRLLAQVRAQGHENHAQLAKKAALSRSMAGAMVKGRVQGHRADALASESRSEQILTQGAEELEYVREKTREEESADLRSSEEKQAEVAREARGHDGPVQRDGHRRRDQRQRSGPEDGGTKAEAANLNDGPAPAHKVHVPPALIQQLVQAVFKAVGPDGRTQMHIHLRGGPLDGVKLEVRAENGQVECTFHGCNRQMGGLVKAGRQSLAEGLEKRGLKLTGLTVA